MTEFQRLCTGRLSSVMAWDRLTALWQRIDPAAGWYLVAVGVDCPRRRIPGTQSGATPTYGMAAADAETVGAFIQRIDALLRAEHHESYCGIVYADDLENPSLIKIYDPNNLGSSCGSSKTKFQWRLTPALSASSEAAVTKTPHPPGWVMSRLPPDEIIARGAAPANRKRWWRGLLGDS